MLKNSINCFEAQSYPNKQMVIVCQERDVATIEFLRANRAAHIKVVEVELGSKRTLGALRNLGIESSDGSFICVWDDDDWHDIDRLKNQYSVLEQGRYLGSILRSILVLDATTDKLYRSHSRNWECTLLCDRRLFAERMYDLKEKGEDSPVVQHFMKKGYLCQTSSSPELYVYVFHGRNTWDRVHFQDFFDRGLLIKSNLDLYAILQNSAPLEVSRVVRRAVAELV